MDASRSHRALFAPSHSATTDLLPFSSTPEISGITKLGLRSCHGSSPPHHGLRDRPPSCKPKLIWHRKSIFFFTNASCCMLRDKIESQVTFGPASKPCVGVNACQPVKLRTLQNPPVPLVGMLTPEISRSQTPHCRQDAARLIEGIGILLVSSSRNQDTVVQTSSAQ